MVSTKKYLAPRDNRIQRFKEQKESQITLQLTVFKNGRRNLFHFLFVHKKVPETPFSS